MKATRVLWLIKGLGLGGAERMLVDALPYHDRGRWGIEVAYLLPWKGFLVPQLEAQGAEEIFGSEFEGLPIALLEAMALGKPVVATSVGGVPEAVTERKDGFLFPVGAIEAIADRVLQLIGDAGLRIKTGAAAAATARTRFDLEANIGRIEEIYASLAQATG